VRPDAWWSPRREEARAPGRGDHRTRRLANDNAVNARHCFVQTLAVLALFTAGRAYGVLGPPYVAVSLLTAALALIAWRARATPADLGISRTSAGAGIGYGAGAFVVVLLALLAAAAIPLTNGFLHDSRAQIGAGRLAYELGVSIVLLTAIPEEFAFRGVLLGSALRWWNPLRASVITSVIFGLWHIAPTLRTMADNHAVAGLAASDGGKALLVLGSIAVTFLAGLAFCWLRLRSGSLIAPVIAHAATNGLALAVAWVTVRQR
jgi:uncharacterized protein